MPLIPQLELCWGTARGVGLPELIDVAMAAGFTSLTASPMLYFEAIRDGLTGKELRSQLDGSGVTISTIDPLSSGMPGTPPAAEIRASLRPFCLFGERDCFEAARELGARTVNVAAFLSGPVEYELMVEHLGTLVRRAGDEGLTISLEFIPGTGLNDLETVLALCRDIASPALGITFDTWHFHRSGGLDRGLSLVEDAAPFVRCVQLSDALVADTEGPYVPMRDRLLPGDGDLPLPALIRPLLKCEPAPPIGLEIFQKKLRQGPPLAAAKLAREHASITLEVL